MGSLLELLFATPVERFLAETWPGSPRHHAGPLARFAELAAEPAIRDIPSMLAAHHGVIQLHTRTPDGAAAHRPIAREDAARRFADGMAMDLRNVERWFGPAQRWLERLRAELSLDHIPASASACQAFVSPAGTRVRKHFDNREVFVVQLRGRKRWRIARNDVLPMPLMPHSVGNQVHMFNAFVPAAALASPEMPADALELVLEPGAALFVPRGFWHDTQALDDSLSFSLNLRAPTWAELFADRVTAELGRTAAWRASAFDLRAQQPVADELIRALKRALAALESELP